MNQLPKLPPSPVAEAPRDGPPPDAEAPREGPPPGELCGLPSAPRQIRGPPSVPRTGAPCKTRAPPGELRGPAVRVVHERAVCCRARSVARWHLHANSGCSATRRSPPRALPVPPLRGPAIRLRLPHEGGKGSGAAADGREREGVLHASAGSTGRSLLQAKKILTTTPIKRAGKNEGCRQACALCC